VAIVKYCARRLLTLIPVLLGITLLAFLLGCLSAGDPAEMVLDQSGDEPPTREQIEAKREELGLNDPFCIQYLRWLKNALHGDLGESFYNRRSVSQELLKRLPVTVRLASLAFLMTAVGGILLGLVMVLFHGRWLDRLLRTAAAVMVSIPGFWLSIFLIGIFAEVLRLLPTSGYRGFQSLILPAVAVSCSSVGVTARLTRSTVLTELGRQYATVASAKGLSGRAVAVRHAFLNSLIPIVTSLGNYFASVLGGSAVAESIFSLNGIGSYAIDAVGRRDYFVIQSYVLLTGTIYVAANLLIDLIYILIDPKIRVGEKNGS